MGINENTATCSNLFLDHVGEVDLTLTSDGISWKSVEYSDRYPDASSCLGINGHPYVKMKLNFSEVYAVELIPWGLIHKSIPPEHGVCFWGRDSKMYRFVVHCYQRPTRTSRRWVPTQYIFGHTDPKACETWFKQINTLLEMKPERPKNLLVFIHPLSGKGKGCKTWKNVVPIFSRAKVKTKVIVTERGGHAFDVMVSMTDKELRSYDGVVVVGGDGFFNEILNGLLSPRHKPSCMPIPSDFAALVQNTDQCMGNDNDAEMPIENENGPLLSGSQMTPCSAGYDSSFLFPNETFRIGIIPSGSTDAIAMSTTGSRDPITSALQIVLGKRICLDITQIVRWKTNTSSEEAPSVRYAASFTGYGFYGDVVKESEKHRWMGPSRYDYSGMKIFLQNRSYEAEVSFLDEKPIDANAINETNSMQSDILENNRKLVCCVNCKVCNESRKSTCPYSSSSTHNCSDSHKSSSWLCSKGRFISIGAAVISCRNERAPDGLVADAHLSDGFLHLILVKDCPRALYLWHLMKLTRKGAGPLNFKFIEHHKTKAFTFSAATDESVWNLDGEVFTARLLSAQVFRGLINLFAAGPEQ